MSFEITDRLLLFKATFTKSDIYKKDISKFCGNISEALMPN
jgi:hypothetical protein